MNDKLYDALEICLQEIENGVALENALARFPDLAHELRPILKASLKARNMAVATPSPEVIRRGRAKLLQRASQMREAKLAPRGKRVIPVFQRLALSLGLTATFLLSGTGLVGASATALPGENLYPVKRTWEDVQLFFIFNKDTRDAVKSQFETERLQEVNELLIDGRHELIQFAGVFTQVNGISYVSGVKVLVPANLQLPANGDAVAITGRTNAQGFVELESIELLPSGVYVPIGNPVEVESGSESHSNSNPNSESVNSNSESINSNSESVNSNTGSNDGTGSGSGSGSQENNNVSGVESEPVNRQSFEVDGTIESLTTSTLVVDGKTVYLDTPAISGELKAGVVVEIKGYYGADGRFMVTEVKVKNSNSGSNSNGGGSGSNSNDHGSGSNSNDHGSDSNSNDGGSGSDNHNGGDDSGKGGGSGGGGG
jgi:hypothetical protein